MKKCCTTLAKPLLQTLDKTLQTSSKPLVPLEGLIFSALKQKQAGWIQSKAFAPGKRLPIKHTIEGLLCKPTFYIKSMAPLVGAYLFPLPPWGGLWGWIQILSAFLLPLEGAGGWTQSKAFAPAKGYLFPSLACSSVFPPKPEQTSAGANKQRVGGGLLSHPFNPGGTPKVGTCSSERRAGIVFHWWPIHVFD